MLIGLISGLVFFLCLILTYLMGLRHGKLLAKNIVPKINLNPVDTFKKYVVTKEEKKKNDDVNEGWFGEDGIMNYNPYKIKDGE